MIELYPNPGSGLFTINLNQKNFDEVTLDVYNILGENILHHRIEVASDQFILDLKAQENGIYFVQIKNRNTLVTKKIAVQH
ncbi:MAG: T9SS type A sorting domain-containing protein [Bacteroidales bacterium]|nr:T9SS type A sorting domain-containing protein [Bacteroidales bacterium]